MHFGQLLRGLVAAVCGDSEFSERTGRRFATRQLSTRRHADSHEALLLFVPHSVLLLIARLGALVGLSI